MGAETGNINGLSARQTWSLYLAAGDDWALAKAPVVNLADMGRWLGTKRDPLPKGIGLTLFTTCVLFPRHPLCPPRWRGISEGIILTLMLLGLGHGIWEAAAGWNTATIGLEKGEASLLDRGIQKFRRGFGDTLIAGAILFGGKGMPWLAADPRRSPFLNRHTGAVRVIQIIARGICAFDDGYFIAKFAQTL